MCGRLWPMLSGFWGQRVLHCIGCRQGKTHVYVEQHMCGHLWPMLTSFCGAAVAPSGWLQVGRHSYVSNQSTAHRS